MPYAPARICNRCRRNATHNRPTVCDECRAAGRLSGNDRPSASQRGYDRQWRNYRQAFLETNPLCAECERQGRVTAATVVDHVRPHRGDLDLFWSADNHQALCERCHNRKTAAGG